MGHGVHSMCSLKRKVILPIYPFEDIICSEEETVRSTFLIQGLLGKDMKAARSFLAFDYVHVKALGNELASKIQ